MNKQAKNMMVVKVDELAVRSAVYLAGKVQAICTPKARINGFGQEHFGFTRTVDFTVDFNKQ